MMEIQKTIQLKKEKDSSPSLFTRITLLMINKYNKVYEIPMYSCMKISWYFQYIIFTIFIDSSLIDEMILQVSVCYA